MQEVVAGERGADVPRRARAATSGWQRMVSAHHPQEVEHLRGDARRRIDHRNVGFLLGGAGNRARIDVERHVGELGPEIAQDRHGEALGEGRRQEDAQRAARLATLAHDLLQRRIDALEGLLDDRQQAAPGLGQRRLLRLAVEQRDAEEILEPDDVAADRALGDQEALGRGGEAAVPADGLESAQGVERQPASVH